MVMTPKKYVELRNQRLEENKKRMEQLNLHNLSQSLAKTLNPKPSPMKAVSKPRTIRTELVPVRRSSRLTDKPAPSYKQVVVDERVYMPRRIGYSKRDLSNRVYASNKGRANATLKAEEVEASLGSEFPTFVKPMLQSHVTGGFWLVRVFPLYSTTLFEPFMICECHFHIKMDHYTTYISYIYCEVVGSICTSLLGQFGNNLLVITRGLPKYFCKRNLPKSDDTVTLIDESGEEWPTVFLAIKAGLSGGWRKFAIDHDLVDGDALVFQLIRATVFKVFIVRVNNFEDRNSLSLKS